MIAITTSSSIRVKPRGREGIERPLSSRKRTIGGRGAKLNRADRPRHTPESRPNGRIAHCSGPAPAPPCLGAFRVFADLADHGLV